MALQLFPKLTTAAATVYQSPHDDSPNLSSSPMIARDAIPRPPQLRHVVSPGGSYHLAITLEHTNASHPVTATLYQNTIDRCQPVWTQRLPQEYGPRYALVTDTGRTLLLDEWINVASPLAIVILDGSGDVLAQYSFDDLVTVIGSPRADIVSQAKQGFWIGGDPVLLEQDQVMVPTAGGRLTIALDTGDLSF